MSAKLIKIYTIIKNRSGIIGNHNDVTITALNINELKVIINVTEWFLKTVKGILKRRMDT